MIDGFFVNPLFSVRRAEVFWENWERCGFSNLISMRRFDAYTIDSQVVKDFPGVADSRVKAAHLSAVECIRQNLHTDAHLLMCEDDVKFSRLSEKYIIKVVNSLDSDSWDVLFLDVIVSDATTMLALLKTKRRCKESQSVGLINPATWNVPHVGGACYLINKKSKMKWLSIFSYKSLDHGPDLLMREFLRKGLINGIILFPYLATVDRVGDDSTLRDRVVENAEWIQQNILWNYFRRLVWVGSDEDQAEVVQCLNEFPSVKDDDQLSILLNLIGMLAPLQMGWGGDLRSLVSVKEFG